MQAEFSNVISLLHSCAHLRRSHKKHQEWWYSTTPIISPNARQVVQDELEAMLEKGVIEKLLSEWVRILISVVLVV